MTRGWLLIVAVALTLTASAAEARCTPGGRWLVLFSEASTPSVGQDEDPGSPQYARILDEIASASSRYGGQIRITGGTDAVGSVQEQLSVASSRAAFVANELERRGVPSSEMVVQWFDATHAAFPGPGPQLLNRSVRVEAPTVATETYRACVAAMPAPVPPSIQPPTVDELQP